MWIQKIIKHGTSLAVVIPAQLCRDAELKRKDFVLLFLDNDNLLKIKRVDRAEALVLLDKEIHI